VTAACSSVRQGGDELDVGEWYGSVTSYDVGHTFTDGLTIVGVTEDAEGPLRLISAEPVMEGDNTLELLGVRVRLLGCGLSGNGWHSFDVLDGFPPSDAMADGSVTMEGFEVPAREETPVGERCGVSPHRLGINLLFGYEVIAAGKSWRVGTKLVYEYRDHTAEAFIQNRLTVCVPAEVECQFVEPGDE